ncbi:hypothetical protein CIRG_03870 [Coccidioides immitis RMSCC 2394]|uniref:Uncharacterized protein n=1 Tax=Coccidioides immitis RMSCC 2394 TaxID=404692 RepID=A0A0J6YAW6_COCIT|nr:hypothetical protein CIRG_03870 [Coccidioides immitis RMSCC 2394]
MNMNVSSRGSPFAEEQDKLVPRIPAVFAIPIAATQRARAFRSTALGPVAWTDIQDQSAQRHEFHLCGSWMMAVLTGARDVDLHRAMRDENHAKPRYRKTKFFPSLSHGGNDLHGRHSKC